jgi:hypothetical protein
VQKEIADIHNDSISKITAMPAGNGEDIMHLKGSFQGPPGTPYEGGTYIIDIKINSEYPFRPPTMKFDTKVWHPNVSSQTVRSTGDVDPSDRKLIMRLGSYLSGHSLLRMVAGPYHQVRTAIPAVAA